MARIVVKNGHCKDMCHDKIHLYAQIIATNLGSLANTIGRPLWPLKDKDNLHFHHLWLLHLYSDSETWNENVCNLQLLTMWNNSLSDPTAKKIAREVGSAHTRVTYLMSEDGKRWETQDTFVSLKFTVTFNTSSCKWCCFLFQVPYGRST